MGDPGHDMCECSDPRCTCAGKCVQHGNTFVERGGIELFYCLQCAIEGVLRHVVSFTLRREEAR